MPYWFVVTRSFRIAWNYKYLWLLALFAGEGGGGFSANYSQQLPANQSRGAPNAAAVQHQIATWMTAHAGLIFAAFVLIILLAIALFLLAAACEGALIRGSAEHDAERPFNLGWAWQAGRKTFWIIVRFRLLLFALALPVLLVFAILVVLFVFALTGHNVVAAVLLGLIGVLFFLLALVYLIYLGFLDRLGIRALVLEQLMARAAIARGHRLLFKRLGRVLLVWLLSIAVGIVVGIVAGIGLAIVGVPIVIAGIALYSSGSSAWWIAVVLGLLILLPIALVVAGFSSAQGSTYWTLAFRRLDTDQAASPTIPPPPPPPPPAPATS